MQPPAAPIPAPAQAPTIGFRTVQVPIVPTIFGVLQLLGWLLALGGIGRLNDVCSEDSYEGSGYCRDRYRNFWWHLCLEVGVMAALVSAVASCSLRKFKLPVSIFLAVATVFTMMDADKCLSYLQVLAVERSSRRIHSWQAATAGFIIMSMLNTLLIIIIGVDEEVDLRGWINNWLPYVTNAFAVQPNAPVTIYHGTPPNARPGGAPPPVPSSAYPPQGIYVAQTPSGIQAAQSMPSGGPLYPNSPQYYPSAPQADGK